jgi:Ca2+-binding EF-hand superfamily protein
VHADIDALLQQADVDGDGEISYDEFAKVMYTE